MIVAKKAYLLKDGGQVVTAKNMIKNTSSEDFEEVTFMIPVPTLRRREEEIEECEE